MSNSLFFPFFRVCVLAIAFFATLAWASRVLTVAPTTSMIPYISKLLSEVQPELWSEDSEQLQEIVSEKRIHGNAWYLYHVNDKFQIYFTYIIEGNKESFSVYCVTEWGASHVVANFEGRILQSGLFDGKPICSDKNGVILLSTLGYMLQSVSSLSKKHACYIC